MTAREAEKMNREGNKDNSVFDEKWHYSRSRSPQYELHRRLKLVRIGKEKKKKEESKCRPRAVSEVAKFAY